MTVIYINRSDSKCGACGQNAIPSEGRHASSPTYGDPRRKGCGAKWTEVDSHYTDIRRMLEDGEIRFPNLAGLPVAEVPA